MKKWLKRNGKWLIIGLGTLLMVNNIYGIATTDVLWKITLYLVGICLWSVIILYISGLMGKIYRWWKKD